MAERLDGLFIVDDCEGASPVRTPQAAFAGFFQALGELGYTKGQNVLIEWRSSGGNAERFPDLAAELARLKVDVIVASDNPAIAGAQRVTRTSC